MSSEEEEYSSAGEVAPPVVEKKARRKRRKKDPSKPRGRLSAYMYFGQTLRPALRQQHPEASVTELAKLIGQKWRELSDDDKKPYEDLAEQDKERYRREMENYVPTPGYERKKKRRNADQPKKPLSAFFLYSAKRRPDLKVKNPEMKLGDFAKVIGSEWREMTDDDKKPFADSAAILKEEYVKAMETYKATLVQ